MGAGSSKETEPKITISAEKITIIDGTRTQSYSRTQGMCITTQIKGAEIKLFHDRLEVPKQNQKYVYSQPEKGLQKIK